jgi:hypothetical protein
MFRSCFQIILLVVVIVATNPSLIFAQSTNTASLSLFINGGGSISPLTNGQLLEVGQSYTMVAAPNPGFAFENWQPANVFTFTMVTLDASGNPTSTNVSVVPSLLPIYTNQPSLNFVMQPVVVIENNPGVMTVTKGPGWQANFVPIILNIQLGDSEAILSWTNSNCTLQAAPAPLGLYTNISGAVSPYKNNVIGPAQYFRLLSN